VATMLDARGMIGSSGMSVRWLVVLTLAIGQGAAAHAQEAGHGVSVRVEDGRLTLNPVGAPLAEVLDAIGAAGDFTVTVRGELAEPVHQVLTDEPLEEAVRALVGAHSLVVLRAAPAAGATVGAISGIRVRANPDAVAEAEAQDVAEDAASQAEAGGEDSAELTRLEREDAYRQAVRDYVPPTPEELTEALRAPDAEDRIIAVPKVGVLEPGEAIAVLERALAEDQDALVRSRAVAALTRIEGQDADRMLRQRALEDGDAELRAQAVNAVASSRGERSVNVLARALREDPDREVRLAAVRALGRIDGDWTRNYLARAARTLDPELRKAAEEALAGR
jgi:HEAT repeats